MKTVVVLGSFLGGSIKGLPSKNPARFIVCARRQAAALVEAIDFDGVADHVSLIMAELACR